MSEVFATAGKPRDKYRLPTDIKPAHYDVVIYTDLKNLKFRGFVVAQYVFDLLYHCDILTSCV